MPSRKGWLTPNAPIPSDTVCRRVLIPNDLQIIAAVNGALLELTKNYNWEQFGSVTPEQMAAAMFAMYQDYVAEPCEGGSSGCRRIYRIGQGGQIELSDDAGETWESAADTAAIPPTPARSEPTEEERLCSAAANVVNVLHQTYEEMIDAWQLDSSVDFGIGAFATILGLLVGSWLGVVSAVAIPFVWELFGGVYATIGTFLQDAWDSDFTDALTCLFLEAATDTGGVVTFDWSAVSQGLADRVTETAAPEDALLWAQLNYMILFIGVEGLNAAGATTGVVGDCDDCGGWCYYHDFSTVNGAFGFIIDRGSMSTNGIIQGVEGTGMGISIHKVMDNTDAPINSVTIWWASTGGGGDKNIFLKNETTEEIFGYGNAFPLNPSLPGSPVTVPLQLSAGDTLRIYLSRQNPDSTWLLDAIRFDGDGDNPYGVNCE